MLLMSFGKFEFKHLFHECEEFLDTREYLKDGINNIDANAGLDETTIRCGIDRTGPANTENRRQGFPICLSCWITYMHKINER